MAMNLAVGQTRWDDATWGVAPGYGDVGLWPNVLRAFRVAGITRRRAFHAASIRVVGIPRGTIGYNNCSKSCSLITATPNCWALGQLATGIFADHEVVRIL